MKRRRILVATQEDGLRCAITSKLEDEGYDVVMAANSQQLSYLATCQGFALLILDSPLFYAGGIETCRHMRSQEATAPIRILMMVANELEALQLMRLDLHIDDLISKPLLWPELLACVHTILKSGKSRSKPHKLVHRPLLRRQTQHFNGQILMAGKLRIDVDRYQVTLDDQPIELSRPLLFELLLYLVQHRGIVMTRGRLLENVWGYDHAYDSRTVDVHVRLLREKLEADPTHPQLIETVRGVGYRLNA